MRIDNGPTLWPVAEAPLQRMRFCRRNWSRLTYIARKTMAREGGGWFSLPIFYSTFYRKRFKRLKSFIQLKQIEVFVSKSVLRTSR